VHWAERSRWEKITPRMCLTHSTGFHNFWFIERDERLRIHFEPATRYSYSGEGFILLQFVIEHPPHQFAAEPNVGLVWSPASLRTPQLSAKWPGNRRPAA